MKAYEEEEQSLLLATHYVKFMYLKKNHLLIRFAALSVS